MAARYLDGETVYELAKEFDIDRRTAEKGWSQDATPNPLKIESLMKWFASISRGCRARPSAEHFKYRRNLCSAT